MVIAVKYITIYSEDVGTNKPGELQSIYTASWYDDKHLSSSDYIKQVVDEAIRLGRITEGEYLVRTAFGDGSGSIYRIEVMRETPQPPPPPLIMRFAT